MSREIEAVRPAGENAQVLSVRSEGNGAAAYRRQPCAGCPWKVSTVGDWPAEAFRHSAETSEDLAERKFGCHETSQGSRPATCAGFLLRGAEHNLGVRMALARGDLDLAAVTDGGHELHGDYVEMAVANGVPADDPALARCRRGSYAAD